MKTMLILIEFISAVGLVITILLHSPKGEGMGAIGGQARVFGTPKGLEAGLDRLTTVLASVFLLAALVLGIFN